MSKKPATKEIIHNDLIHEVEETIKQQELEKFWKEYKVWIIGGIVCAIALTATMSGWRTYNYKVNTAQTATLVQALSSEQDDIAGALTEMLPSLRSGHRAMAFLSKAGAMLRADRKEEAFAVYEQAAADKSLPAPWHDLAVLLSVRAEWSAAKGDTTQALIEKLGPLVSNSKSPWYYHARLQTALMLAHDMKDYALARTHLAAIQRAQDIPPSLQERAKALNHIYTIRMNEQAKVKTAAPDEKPEG